MYVKELIEKIQDLEDSSKEKKPKFYGLDWCSGYESATNDIICMLYDIQEQQIRDEFTADDLIGILKAKDTITIDLDAHDVIDQLLSNV